MIYRKVLNSLMDTIPPLLTIGISDPPALARKAPLHQANYPHVHFWTITPYHIFVATIKETNENSGLSAASLCGASHASHNINVTMQYLKDEHSVSVDGNWATQARNVAYSIFFQLLNHGLALETWGAAGSNVLAQYCNKITSQIP